MMYQLYDDYVVVWIKKSFKFPIEFARKLHEHILQLHSTSFSPIASSISFRSSSEILGCLAGVSKINKNQQSDHNTPIVPVKDLLNQNIIIKSCLSLTSRVKHARPAEPRD